MTAHDEAVIIGGILPALLYGISGVFQKSSTQAGIGTGLYLFCISAGVAAAGAIISWRSPDGTISLRSGIFASMLGLSWGLGMGLVAIALTAYAAPLSRLAPLYNMNTLVAVILALVVFSEWKEVAALRLLAGALLIVAGGALVARS